MSQFYSGSEKGFFDDAVNSAEAIPKDAVKLRDGERDKALAHESAGGVIAGVHSDGTMILQDAPARPPEDIEAHKIALVQRHMDAAARSLRYDDIASAITYAEEPAVPKFQAEGRAFREWRSLVWQACYAILADVQACVRAIPTDAELIEELPVLMLPSE